MEVRHDQAKRDMDELIALASQSEDLARALGKVFDSEPMIAEIDDAATERANGRITIYKLPDGYLRLLAAARAGQFKPSSLPIVSAHGDPPVAVTGA